MIKHYVMFSFSNALSLDERNEIYKEIKLSFEQLPNKIEELITLNINRNINEKETYDFLLTASLENIEKLEGYAKHPEHQNLVKSLIKPNVKARACLDIEL